MVDERGGDMTMLACGQRCNLYCTEASRVMREGSQALVHFGLSAGIAIKGFPRLQRFNSVPTED